MESLQTQLDELQRLLTSYQRSQNAVNAETIRCIDAANRLDDYRGQQIAAVEHSVDLLRAAVRASFADPADTAERILKAVDDDE